MWCGPGDCATGKDNGPPSPLAREARGCKSGRLSRSTCEDMGPMKLVRFGPKGAETPGLIDANGQLRDLSGLIGEFRPELMTFDLLDRLSGLAAESLPVVDADPRL